jgi:hypothetical protein
VTLGNHFRSGLVAARSEHSPVSVNTTRSDGVIQMEMTPSRFKETRHGRRTVGAQPCKCELALIVNSYWIINVD